LPDVDVNLTGISRWLACTWGRDGVLLLSLDSSGSIGIFKLLSLLVCFSILWWHIRRDDQDLAIWGLELFSRIVRGDCCMGDLERKAVRRRLLVHSTAVSNGEGSTKLLVNRAWFVEVIPAVSTILGLGSWVQIQSGSCTSCSVMLHEQCCASQEACWRLTRSCEGV
jgi:hypothetical protein